MLCSQLNRKLCFDRVEADIKLAKAYIEKHNGQFYSPNATSENNDLKTVKDNYGNTIYITPPSPEEQKPLFTNGAKLLSGFANKLLENTDLFAQLEFIIRGLPQHDVKKYDIHLIYNCFDYYGLMCTVFESYTKGEFHIHMRNETPLCTLGIVADQLFKSNRVIIHASRNTAVICNLFLELLHESGFTKGLVTIFTEENDVQVSTPYEGHLFFFTPLKSGSTAVVTEQADVRAALCTLLKATTTTVYPWHLRRIYVQENIYESFKSILSEKASVQCGSSNDIKAFEQLKARSSAVFFHSDKSILLDYTDDTDEHTLNVHLVLVEAYRTTKELLLLMYAHPCNYMSLWCNDLSTANEIALAADVTNVWINEFGTFDGPMRIAPSFYGMHDFQKCSLSYSKAIHNEKEISTIQKMLQNIRAKQTKWKKLGIEKRRCIIVGLLEKYKYSISHVDGLLGMIDCGLRRYHPDSKVKVENNKVCLQLNQAISNLCILIGECKSDLASDLIEFILNGNAVVTCHPNDYDMLKFFAKHSDETGIPMGQLQLDEVSMPEKSWMFSKFKDVNVVNVVNGFGKSSIYKPKTIQYQYGESFAN